MADELGDDFGDQRLESLVKAVFAPIERGVAMHDPAHVAGPVRTQHKRLAGGVLGAKQALDAARRLGEAAPLLFR